MASASHRGNADRPAASVGRVNGKRHDFPSLAQGWQRVTWRRQAISSELSLPPASSPDHGAPPTGPAANSRTQGQGNQEARAHRQDHRQSLPPRCLPHRSAREHRRLDGRGYYRGFPVHGARTSGRIPASSTAPPGKPKHSAASLQARVRIAKATRGDRLSLNSPSTNRSSGLSESIGFTFSSISLIVLPQLPPDLSIQPESAAGHGASGLPPRFRLCPSVSPNRGNSNLPCTSIAGFPRRASAFA